MKRKRPQAPKWPRVAHPGPSLARVKKNGVPLGQLTIVGVVLIDARRDHRSSEQCSLPWYGKRQWHIRVGRTYEVSLCLLFPLEWLDSRTLRYGCRIINLIIRESYRCDNNNERGIISPSSVSLNPGDYGKDGTWVWRLMFKQRITPQRIGEKPFTLLRLIAGRHGSGLVFSMNLRTGKYRTQPVGLMALGPSVLEKVFHIHAANCRRVEALLHCWRTAENPYLATLPIELVHLIARFVCYYPEPSKKQKRPQKRLKE